MQTGQNPDGEAPVSQQPSDEPSDQQPSFPSYPQQQFPAAPPLGGEYGSAGGGYPGGFGGDPGQFGPPRTSKLAITSLILGILSLPLVFVGIGPLVALVGLILGIVGIVGAQRKNLKRAVGIAGIVLSLIGLIGGGFVLAAGLHAVNQCKNVDKNNTTVYDQCIKDHFAH
jgi:hypothetical protein